MPMRRLWQWLGRLADGLSIGQLLWTVIGGTTALAALFSWAALAWERIAREGVGAAVILGAAMACLVVISIGVFLVGWRYFWPQRVIAPVGKVSVRRLDPEKSQAIVSNLFEFPDRPTISYDSPKAGEYNADQFIIQSRNNTGAPIHLDDAFIQSGITGEKRPMKIRTRDGLAEISEINAIPPGATIHLEVDFHKGVGLRGTPERVFVATWGKVDVVVRYGGRAFQRTYLQETIQSVFDELANRNRPIAPVVTKRQLATKSNSSA